MMVLLVRSITLNIRSPKPREYLLTIDGPWIQRLATSVAGILRIKLSPFNNKLDVHAPRSEENLCR